MLVALILVVAFVAAATTYLVMRDRDSASETTAGETTTTTSPTTSTTEPPAPEPIDEETLAEEVERLSAFVEAQRGLEFIEEVDVSVIGDDEFEELLLEDFEEDVGDLEILQRLLAALGLLEPGADVVDGMVDLLGAGVLGFYDTEQERLVVRGTELTPLVRMTLVHELVHALDDQWFELYRPEYVDRDDEISFGFVSVVEGSAQVVEQAWMDSLSSDEMQELMTEQAQMVMGMDLDGVPWVLVELIAAPYEAGLAFAQELISVGGWELIDEAFEEPPTTSSQVLHPDRYLSDMEAVEVEPPPAEGEVFDEGAFGEMSLRLVLESAVSPSDATTAASGWRGDAMVAWEDDEGTDCVRVDTETSNPVDRDQLASALEDYAEGRPSVEVELLDELSVRFTACTDDAASGAESAV